MTAGGRPFGFFLVPSRITLTCDIPLRAAPHETQGISSPSQSGTIGPDRTSNI
jgi:hypothetical protein